MPVVGTAEGCPPTSAVRELASDPEINASLAAPSRTSLGDAQQDNLKPSPEVRRPHARAEKFSNSRRGGQFGTGEC
jgi:hypothetical protein